VAHGDPNPGRYAVSVTRLGLPLARLISEHTIPEPSKEHAGDSNSTSPVFRPGTARPIQALNGTAGSLSVWSSISASGAFRFADSMPLIALALLA
jgi:hypothetical protein